MAKKVKPHGIEIRESMQIRNENSVDSPKRGIMSGEIAHVWCVANNGVGYPESDSYPSLENVIECLKWAKKKLDDKYFTIRISCIDVELDEFGNTEPQLWITGERNETDKEFKIREKQHWSGRKSKLEQDEMKANYWKTTEGKAEKKKIKEMTNG